MWAWRLACHLLSYGPHTEGSPGPSVHPTLRRAPPYCLAPYQGSRGLPGLNFAFLVFFSIFSLPRQVLFHDVTFTMGQVVSRESQGRRETLFRCVRSMPSDPDRAYNSCYSAGENSGVRRGLL